MVLLFSHEFTPEPLSLCDGQDFNLLNQQQKSEIVKLFEKEFPNRFSTSHPRCDNGRWALIIDGGPLLEIRPSKINGKVFDYAKQLLTTHIIPIFITYDRIDIVFDSDRSKSAQSFIKRHGQNDSHADQYDLKPTDVPDSSNSHRFVHSHRARLAKIVRLCWSQDELIDLLPIDKCLIVAGPQDESIKLMNKTNLVQYRVAKSLKHWNRTMLKQILVCFCMSTMFKPTMNQENILALWCNQSIPMVLFFLLPTFDWSCCPNASSNGTLAPTRHANSSMLKRSGDHFRSVGISLNRIFC